MSMMGDKQIRPASATVSCHNAGFRGIQETVWSDG